MLPRRKNLTQKTDIKMRTPLCLVFIPPPNRVIRKRSYDGSLIQSDNKKLFALLNHIQCVSTKGNYLLYSVGVVIFSMKENVLHHELKPPVDLLRWILSNLSCLKKFKKKVKIHILVLYDIKAFCLVFFLPLLSVTYGTVHIS